MATRKLLQVLFGLLVLFAVAAGLISINHPILLKWLTGSARHHGKPIPATVYVNGQVNERIKVFYTDEADNYLLCLAEDDDSGILKFINIDLNEKWVGKPDAASKQDYDFIGGHLFQSEAGRRFSAFQNTEGFNVDPQLTFADGQITFNMPSNNLNLNHIKIILP